MKIIIENNSDNIYSLNNLDNYNKNLNENIDEIVKIYWQIIINYLKCIIEKIKPKKKNYSKFIIMRGFDTITNVFNNILFYTKNLDLTFYHCQKAYYYYIEFIQQITEDQHVFLQLSSRDASTYVYKKNIFEINHDITKSMPSTDKDVKIKLDVLNQHVIIFKHVLDSGIQNFDLETKSLDSRFELINKLDIIYEHIYLLKLDNSSLKIILKSFELIYEINIENNELYLDSLFTFLKKCGKNTNKIINNIEKKILLIDLKEITANNSIIHSEYLLKYFFS